MATPPPTGPDWQTPAIFTLIGGVAMKLGTLLIGKRFDASQTYYRDLRADLDMMRATVRQRDQEIDEMKRTIWALQEKVHQLEMERDEHKGLIEHLQYELTMHKADCN